MNVFSRYCPTFNANDCVFSLNEQQKVYKDFFVTHVSFSSFCRMMHFSSLGGSTTGVMCIYFTLAGEEERWNRNNSVNNTVQ